MTKYMQEKETRFKGKAFEFKFPNGYGASVVSHEYSYGGDEGLWELAFLDKSGRPTHEVLGYLTWDEVLEEVKNIRRKRKCMK